MAKAVVEKLDLDVKKFLLYRIGRKIRTDVVESSCSLRGLESSNEEAQGREGEDCRREFQDQLGLIL